MLLYFETNTTLRLHISDTELIPALHNGESAAYTTVYEHFVGSVCFFIEQIVKNKEVAEDIAAEAFIRTFRKHTDFTSVGKLKSFLYTVAGNAAIDYLRSEKRRLSAFDDIGYLSDECMDDAELAYIRTEARRALHEAIQALPSQCREVIKLLFIEGKTLSEVAEELNIAYKTVQNQKAKGLSLIRTQLVKNPLLSAVALWWALNILETH